LSFLAIVFVLSLLLDGFWLHFWYLFGHYIVSPSSRLLVTLLVSFWPLYCLSFFTASGYIFGIFLAIALSLLLDGFWLHFWYPFGHYIVSPSSWLLVTLLVSFWPLYCLSFLTASGYTFGIFLAIVLSLLLDGFWLHFWYLFGHYIVSPSSRLLVTLLVSSTFHAIVFRYRLNFSQQKNNYRFWGHRNTWFTRWYDNWYRRYNMGGLLWWS
jgi:hypothetical protein